ncbi:MAG: glycosyltransferase family 2 protein [Clostridia bacterium]|nr:glycosyltransferase family 2 protein [Clostridia bacterium]
MDKRIAAIVVTYNRKEYLLRCIEALEQQACPQLDILLIDNASTDGTAEAVTPLAEAGRVQYINTGANLGGAGGFNFGMRAAMEAGYDYLWIMDDDCIPDPGALAALLEADRKLEGNYGFLSSIAYWQDGSPCNMNVQKTGLKSKIEDYESPLVPVIMATFVSAFFPACRVREVGLPIKEFFIWSDDLEYTRRLSLKYPCYAVNGSRVLHDMKSNDKVNIATDSPDRLGRYRYLYRNEVYVYRREGLRGWVYLVTRVAYHLAKVVLKSSHKVDKLKVILSSFFSGFGFRPPVEKI